MGYVQQGHGGIGGGGCYTNGLRRGLVAYWRLEEASGTRADATGRGNNLTDNNTVLSATGIFGNAADFELDNSESLSIADNTDLSTGDVTFTIPAWVNMESLPAAAMIASKANDAGAISAKEYWLYFDSSRFRFRIFGSAANTAVADTFGAPSTATWYHVVGWHDADADTINIQINNGDVDSVATSTTPNDAGTAFAIGATAAAEFPFDGLIDEVGFWKRLLTAQEKTRLYNAGVGRSWPNL